MEQPHFPQVAKAEIQILRTPEVVFPYLITAKHFENYFAHSSDDFKEGQTVQWWFPEFPDRFDVKILKVEAPNILHFDWFGGIEGKIVKIHLEAFRADATIVRIEETGLGLTEDGQWEAVLQTGGWANFLACLKAYIEYGIRLREGSFDFMAST